MSNETLFRGRGRWMSDLALISAGGLRSEPAFWTIVVAGVTVVAALLLGLRSVVIPVAGGLLLRHLVGTTPPGQRVARVLRLIWPLGLAALAILVWWLHVHRPDIGRYGITRVYQSSEKTLTWSVAAERAVRGAMLLAVVILGPFADVGRRRALARTLPLLLLSALALHFATAYQYRLGPLSTVLTHEHAIVTEAAVLLLLGLVVARRSWILWTLATAAVLTIARGPGEWLPEASVAGPLLVVLAARASAAVGAEASAEDADAAAARIARRMQRNPWRTTLLAVALAFVFAYDFNCAAYRLVDAAVAGGVAGAVVFYALPGALAVTVAVLFHAALRAETLSDRLPPLVVPLSVVVLGWIVVAVVGNALRGSTSIELSKTLFVVAGIGPVLPVVVGLVCGRRSSSDRRGGAAVVAACVAIMLIVAAARNWKALETALDSVIEQELQLQLLAVAGIPWLVAFHTLATGDLSAQRMFVGCVVLSAAAGLATVTAIERYAGDRSLGAIHLSAFVLSCAAFVPPGVALARRLRAVTALPEDHAVLHWQPERRR